MPADLASLQLVIDSKQVTQANSQLTILVKLSKDAEQAQKGMASGSAAAGSGFDSLLAKITAVGLGLVSLKKLFLDPIIDAAEFEATKAGFDTILGSAEKSKKFLEDLRKFANETPFQFEQLTNAAQQFIGAGFQTEEVIPILKAVGDAMFSLNKGADGVQRATLAITQMKTAGRLNGQELRQLTELNVNARKYLEDFFGVTREQLDKLLRDGVIDSNEAIKVILNGMENQYKNGMQTVSRLTKGLWSTLMDELHTVSVGLGEALIEGFDIKGKLQGSIDIVRLLGALLIDVARGLAGLEPKWAANKELVKGITDFIGNIWPNIEKGFYSVEGWVEKVFARIKYNILTVVDAVRGGIADIITNIRSVLSAIDKIAGAGLLGAGGGIAAFLGTKGIKTTAGGVNEGMAALGGAAGNLTSSFANSVMTGKTPFDPPELTGMLDAIDAKTELNKKMAENDSFIDFVKRNDLVSESLKATLGPAATFSGATDAAKNHLSTLADEMKKADETGKALNTTLGSPDLNKALRASPETILNVQTKGFDQLRDLNTEVMLVTKTKEQRELILDQLKLQDLYDEKHIKMTEYDKQLLGSIAELRKRLQTLEEIKGVASDIGKAFGDAFEDAALNAKSFRDVMLSLVKDIEKSIFEVLVRKPIQNFVTNGLTSLISGALGVSTAPVGIAAPSGSVNFPGFGPPSAIPTLPSWKGNIFGPGGLIPFALGGVVNGPTLFPFARGTGLMGERGPEAIMPLTRGSDGKLGVKASGSKVTNVTMNVYTNDADSFRKSSRQIAQGLRKATGN